jgi:hypothetical protein
MKKIVIFSHDDHFLEELIPQLIKEKYLIQDCFLAENYVPEIFYGYDFRIHLRKVAMAGNYSELGQSSPIDQDDLIKYSEIEQIFNRMCDCIDFNGRQFSGIERRRYFQDLLRYGKKVLNLNSSIDFIFFTDNPHSPHDVVFAMLCEANNVPIKILRETHIRGRYFLQTDLFGRLNLKGQAEHDKNSYSSFELPEDVQNFKLNVTRRIYGPPSIHSFRRNHKIAYEKPYFYYRLLNNHIFFNLLVILSKYKFISKHLIKATIKKIIRRKYQPLSEELSDIIKIKKTELFLNKFRFLDNQVILIKGNLYKKFIKSIYDDIESKDTISNIIKQKYVYFPLHYQPEATTYPYGGLYIDQLLALELLSASLPAGVFILVKEHPDTFNISGEAWVRGAFSRDPNFYNRIAILKNVIICPLNVDSFELIDKALFVATITGTTALEAIFRSKYSIVFGSAWFADFDGIFSCTNADQLMDSIETIIKNDFKMNSVSNNINLKRFAEVSFICNRDISNSVSAMSLQESSQVIVGKLSA